MCEREATPTATSIKSVKETFSWSTYCAKAPIVYLGRTISQEWGIWDLPERQTGPSGSSWRDSTRPWSGGPVSLMVRSGDDADGVQEEEEQEEEDSGTCLTKHSCGRYLVHATARTGPPRTERCAQNTSHSSASRGTEIGERRMAVMPRRARRCITSLPMYKSQPIYSIQHDTRLTTLGRERGRP